MEMILYFAVLNSAESQSSELKDIRRESNANGEETADLTNKVIFTGENT